VSEENLNGQAAPLSERELEIVGLVASGLSNKEIASRLSLSVNTVKVHLRNIFGKIGVQSRTEATMYAVSQGWVVVPEAIVGGAEPALAEQAVPAPETWPQVVIPPLPWTKRIALVAIVLLTILGVTVTWPRSAPAASTRSGEFSDVAGGEALSTAGSGDTVWQARAQMPTARGRLALTSLEGKLYAIGGVTSAGVTGAVEIYDPQSDAWSAGSSKPLPVANISAAVLGALIYVPGGYTASGAPTAVVEAYNPAQDAWSSDVAPLPAPVFAYALAVYQQKMYLFGGSNGQGYLATSYVYDPQTDRWAAIAPMPTARGFAAAGVLNDAIYVVGGYDGQQDLAVCERYLPATDQWEACAPLSVGRGGLGMVAMADKKLYAIGGGWNGYLAFGERYTPAQDKWSAIATPLIGQWRNLAVANIGPDIYAVGGWNGQAHLSVNVTYSPFIKIFLPVGGSSKTP
jgi:DNA-binding CsgD family transcriptional regulator/N-acetylneuraminic acid mutarotase